MSWQDVLAIAISCPYSSKLVAQLAYAPGAPALRLAGFFGDEPLHEIGQAQPDFVEQFLRSQQLIVLVIGHFERVALPLSWTMSQTVIT